MYEILFSGLEALKNGKLLCDSLFSELTDLHKILSPLKFYALENFGFKFSLQISVF